ncbi:laminin subunit alpha lam-3-like isoform X1 [Crassostrea virginica]
MFKMNTICLTPSGEFLIALFVTLSWCSCIGNSIPMCDGNLNNGCCLGYTWNPSSQSCEKCTPGYTGLNCTIRCPYPSYGENCQRNCTCSKEDCDVSTGCRTVTTEISIFPSCRPGYTGRNCRGACVYPYYGTE